MEVYRTIDGTVAKYVHDDGSETAIKTTPVTTNGGVYGKVINKYNVFISTSVGCSVDCRFCYLTTKGCPVYNLKEEEIINNVLASVEAEVLHRPNLKNLFCKLSWMGMGDAYFDTQKMYKVSCSIAGAIIKNGLAKGVDGIDISTTLPKVPKKDADGLIELTKYINCYILNPKRNYGLEESRYPVRLFYSYHGGEEDIRKFLIPHSVSEKEALQYLLSLKEIDVTVVIHHMFFEGINDTLRDAGNLLSFIKELGNVELRLLRFNECPGTIFRESSSFDKLVEHLYKFHKNIKVQASPGAEISASCGMFLLSKFNK